MISFGKKALKKKPIFGRGQHIDHDAVGPSVRDRWESFDPASMAQEAVRALGIPVAMQPGDDAPTLPRDITQVSSEELGYLYGSFVAYTAYLADQTALAEIDAEKDQGYFDHLKAEVRLRKSGTVADKDAKTLNDPEIQELEQQLLVSQAKARLLKARERGFDKKSNALSREMTRRGITAP